MHLTCTLHQEQIIQQAGICQTWVNNGCTGWNIRVLWILEGLHREVDVWCCHQTNDDRPPGDHTGTLREELLVDEGLQQCAFTSALLEKQTWLQSIISAHTCCRKFTPRTRLASDHNHLWQFCQRVLYIGLVLRQRCKRGLDLTSDLQQTIHWFSKLAVGRSGTQLDVLQTRTIGERLDFATELLRVLLVTSSLTARTYGTSRQGGGSCSRF